MDINNFDYKKYLSEMRKNSRKHIQIIALFAQLKNYSFDNKEQMKWFISRNLRVAKRLDCFNLDKIEKTLRYLLETAEFKVTIESIEKFVLEDFKELEGNKPLITLKNGEKIYSTKRLNQLEFEGKVKYVNSKWVEINGN